LLDVQDADERKQPPRGVEIDRDLSVEPVHQHLGRLVVERTPRHVDGLDLLRGRGLSIA
jgi:replicative DNA helicase